MTRHTISAVGFVLLTALTVTGQRKPSFVESLLHLVMVDGSANIAKEPRDERVISKVSQRFTIPTT